MKYVVFPFANVDQVDFTDVRETSLATLRVSIDGLKTFVKYEGTIPASVDGIVGREAPRTHAQMVELLSNGEW